MDMSGRHPAACPALAAPHLEASAVSSATLVLPSMPPAAGQLRRAVHPGLGVAAVAGPGRHARLRAVPGRPGAARVAVLPAGAGALGRGQGGAADAARHGRGGWGTGLLDGGLGCMWRVWWSALMPWPLSMPHLIPCSPTTGGRRVCRHLRCSQGIRPRVSLAGAKHCGPQVPGPAGRHRSCSAVSVFLRINQPAAGEPASCLPLPPQSWKNLVARHNLPMTIMSTVLAFLQQLTGINVSEAAWGCLAGQPGLACMHLPAKFIQPRAAVLRWPGSEPQLLPGFPHACRPSSSMVRPVHNACLPACLPCWDHLQTATTATEASWVLPRPCSPHHV